MTATFEVPWTSERISPAGRRALLAAGIAPPTAPIENGGGPTLIDLERRVPCHVERAHASMHEHLVDDHLEEQR